MAREFTKSKDKSTEKVTLFGEDLRHNYTHEHKPGSFFGVLLIFSGVILLLNTLGVVTWDIWNELLRFWPLIPIFFGLQIILGRNFISRLFLFLLAVTLFGSVFLYVLLLNAPNIAGLLPENILKLANFWEVIKR